ncbi:hypothetical protein DM02DRAFT_611869 [Periconia macrospinosa]|uniref:Proteasome assembly chaperone 3 n=1 Tax=Periconia macrospinosa TaxID=97972 RepID=A0A2V1E0H4_9PLEO|nr:hypothetical protein DM02DRAFT_611869 [Periconia macrospinosa]
MTTSTTSQPAQTIPISRTPFPSSTLTSRTHLIRNLKTVATRTYFSDKIVVTVTQEGRLGHWTQTPLSNTSPTPTTTFSSLPPSSSDDTDDNDHSNALLPNPHLTTTTLLGSAAIPDLDILAQTLATQIASAIQSRGGGGYGESREERTLVLGTGLDKSVIGDREAYAELVGLVLDVL